MLAAGAASQADVWTLLDKWASNKDAKGLLAATLERYTAPLWGPVTGQAPELYQASILSQELYLEAETKLVFMFAFMAHCKKMNRLPAWSTSHEALSMRTAVDVVATAMQARLVPAPRLSIHACASAACKQLSTSLFGCCIAYHNVAWSCNALSAQCTSKSLRCS